MSQTTVHTLQQQAIQAAKKLDWSKAIELNQHILQLEPRNVSAFNRLGIAQLQAGTKKAAREAFKTVLEIDKHNIIAKKNLAKLKNNKAEPTGFSAHFIEEPGKTKITALHRVTGKDKLEQLSIGQMCSLIPKKRYISVEVDGDYIGALAEDISFRLSKLIDQGNTYKCQVKSVDISNCECWVFLKETFQSEQNIGVTSFPSSKNNAANLIDIPDEMLEEEHIPVVMINTDDDDESSESYDLVKEIAQQDD